MRRWTGGTWAGVARFASSLVCARGSWRGELSEQEESRARRSLASSRAGRWGEGSRRQSASWREAHELVDGDGADFIHAGGFELAFDFAAVGSLAAHAVVAGDGAESDDVVEGGIDGQEPGEIGIDGGIFHGDGGVVGIVFEFDL